jgi:hypothetical protein
MKSVDKNCKSDHVRGRGETVRSKFFSRERKENLYTNEAGMPHARVM